VAANLAVTAGTGIGPLFMQVARVEAQTGSGFIRIKNFGDLVVGGVDPALSGARVSSATGASQLSSTGSLTLEEGVATAGVVVLNAAGAISQGPAGTITAAALGARTSKGDIVLDQANTAPLFAAQNTTADGSVSFRTTGAVTLDSVAKLPEPPSMIQAIDGVSTTGAGSAFRLQAGGSVTQTAAGRIVLGGGPAEQGKFGVRTTAGDITLDQPNRVGTLAVRNDALGGSLLFVEDDALAVGTVTADGAFPATRGIKLGATLARGDATLRMGTDFTAVDTDFAHALIDLNLAGVLLVSPGQTPVAAGQENSVVRTEPSMPRSARPPSDSAARPVRRRRPRPRRRTFPTKTRCRRMARRGPATASARSFTSGRAATSRSSLTVTARPTARATRCT
jgi:hypothetical protein